jgi:hypothetical protein
MKDFYKYQYKNFVLVDGSIGLYELDVIKAIRILNE